MKLTLRINRLVWRMFACCEIVSKVHVIDDGVDVNVEGFFFLFLQFFFFCKGFLFALLARSIKKKPPT